MFLRILFAITLMTITNLLHAQVYISEVSQGVGSAEYVELVVVGNNDNTDCTTECIDIRGWILDDNNGTFASGSDKGIASGAVRFSNHTQWSCVKPGARIIVYNENNKNSNIPTDDLTDNNCDFTYVLPTNNNTYFDGATNLSRGYGSADWSKSPNWNLLNLRNGGDSFQVIDPNNTTQPFHALSWGDNTNNNIIYFSGSASGLVFSMQNTIDNDPSKQANWTSESVSGGNETPGAGNNTVNENWANTFNADCKADASGDKTFSCGETVTATTLSTKPDNATAYVWSSGDNTQSISVTPSVTKTYTVTVTVGACETTSTVTITIESGQIGFLKK